MSRSDKRKRHAKLPGKPALAAMPSVQATERRLTRALTGTIETAVEDNGSSMASRPRSRRVSQTEKATRGETPRRCAPCASQNDACTSDKRQKSHQAKITGSLPS